jgi:hypothetical protein
VEFAPTTNQTASNYIVEVEFAKDVLIFVRIFSFP